MALQYRRSAVTLRKVGLRRAWGDSTRGLDRWVRLEGLDHDLEAFIAYYWRARPPLRPLKGKTRRSRCASVLCHNIMTQRVLDA